MNESIYDQLTSAQKEMDQVREKMIALRQQLQPEPISDYPLLDRTGKEVHISSLFNERDELMIIHNMGKRCSYCTLWADGINSFTDHISNRFPFVLVSPDEPAVQKEISQTRGWKFDMLSAHGSSFIADLGYEPKPGNYWPGVSALIRKDGMIYRVGKDFFGPGDLYCSIWHFFDLFPKGANDWSPKMKY